MRADFRHLVPAAMTLILIGGSTAAATVASPAVSNQPPIWTQGYALGGTPAAAVASANTVFITGSSAGHGTGLDYATIAYNAATGARLWAARYNGQAKGADSADAIAVSPDGTVVFVTGGSTGSRTGLDYATIAYNAATGARLWVTRFNGTGNGTDIAHAIGVSPDGTKLFVTGESAGHGSGADYVTIAYNAATGTQLWRERYSGAGARADVATSMAVSPDGGEVYVTGHSATRSAGFDYVTIGYNTNSGGRLWTVRYNGKANGDDIPSGLAVTPDGHEVAVTGTSGGVGDDYATVAYSETDGSQLWATRYNGTANKADVATGLAIGAAPGGGWNVVVTGYSDIAGFTGFDFITIGYNATTGTQAWLSDYTSVGKRFDKTAAITVAPGGQLWMNGTGKSGKGGLVTIAYKTTNGTPQRTDRYIRPAIITAVAIATNNDEVFSIGHADQGPGFVTLAYHVVPAQ
ncbi:MAG TPA: PQQ-binding-like beta-propeller repeat protein [Streptosporangiaceae bacterium]|nr:PQQ-binding-like beta-propeller repeat protein [Streptosporangiaceae bacterium]